MVTSPFASTVATPVSVLDHTKADVLSLINSLVKGSSMTILLTTSSSNKNSGVVQVGAAVPVKLIFPKPIFPLDLFVYIHLIYLTFVGILSTLYVTFELAAC